MKKQDVAGGDVHDIPDDMREALLADPKVLAIWYEITPLARNE